MKHLHTLINCLSLLLTTILSACTADVNELFSTTDSAAGSTLEHTCKLTLNADYPAFLDDSGTRAEAGRWEEGDQIYIRFSSTTYGVGTYKDDEWEFSYNGKLVNIQGAQCAVYYLKGENVSYDNDKTISFDAKTAVFGTETGIFTYSNKYLTVASTLLPLTSRMRFKGNDKGKITLLPSEGLKHYATLDIATKQLTSVDVTNTDLSVNAVGFTDYVYVVAESDVMLEAQDKFNKFSDHKIDQSKFTIGASGVLALPMEDSHEGWTMEKRPLAQLKNGEQFNQIIKTLTNGHSMALNDTDSLIQNIIIDCNSQVKTGELLSIEESGYPIYANYKDGTITMSTPADIIYATDMRYMFNGCSVLTSLDLSNFYTRNVTRMDNMFRKCSALTSLDISNFDTRNVTDMRYMFNGCSMLTSLDISNFDTRNVTRMGNMFNGCSVLTSLDISNFDTRNVTNMGNMFLNCLALTSLDISNFDTRNVTNMSYMFNGCSVLTSLDLSNFDTKNVTDMGYMFDYCYALTSLDISNFDTKNVTRMHSMFGGCSELTSLSLGRQFVICDEKGAMCHNLANNVSSLTITCTEAAKVALQDGTGLDNSKVTWNIIQ